MEQVKHPYTCARMPYCPSNMEEAMQNFATRARQLLPFEYVWMGSVGEHEFGYVTHFNREGEIYTAIRQNSTSHTTCYEVMDYIDDLDPSRTIVFGDQLGKALPGLHHPPTDWIERYQYKHVELFYGSKRAERSNVLKMNHIDEAITIMVRAARLMPEYQDVDVAQAITAFCLHPMFQGDTELVAYDTNSIDVWKNFTAIDMMHVMEYRSVANEYLSHRHVDDYAHIRLSPLRVVNLMMIGDKVQNYKDFLKYHFETHPRTRELATYFQNWLDRLGVNAGLYHKLIKHIPSV